MRTIDVSGPPLKEGMWDYRPLIPSVPLYEAKHFATIEKDGWEGTKITLATPLTGAYLETPAHRVSGSFTIDEVDPARFFPEAVVLNVSPKGPHEPVTRKELQDLGVEIKKGDAALVATGWDSRRGDPSYVTDGPYFERDAVQWLVDQGIDILAGDWAVFDNLESPQGVCDPLDAAGGMLLAPLANLTQIPRTRVKLIAVPLRLEGLCASPCRPFILVED